MNPSRLRYYHGAQQIQRDAIIESVSSSYTLACADALTRAESQALNNPGCMIPFEVQVNGTQRTRYTVTCLK